MWQGDQDLPLPAQNKLQLFLYVSGWMTALPETSYVLIIVSTWTHIDRKRFLDRDVLNIKRAEGCFH